MTLKTIRVGSLFSGIGAFEVALEKLGLPYEIVFACDNGEIELVPLDDVEDRNDVILLRKKRCKTNEERERLMVLEAVIRKREEDYRQEIKSLATTAIP